MRLSHRPCTAGDRQVCLDIFHSNVPDFFRDHELASLTDFLDSSGCPYFVVLLGTEVVGCGGFGLRVESRTADLCWGMVHRERHRKRIGAYLLCVRLLSIAETTEAMRVRLETSQHTEGFFHRFGFETQAVKPDGIDAGLDEVEMQLDLTHENISSIKRPWQEVVREMT